MMTGVSSYYAEDFHGKLTANGEVYDMHGLTAAHKTLPLNTIVRVTNVDNNKSLILRINDRGPYVKGRILDCSYGAALKLGFVGKGTTKVKIEVIEFGDNKYMKHKKS
jgi:rare lipoprotein A